jgi:hypothetical protein
MDSRLTVLAANERIAELHRSAARYRRARDAKQSATQELAGAAVTLRVGAADDERLMAGLSALCAGRAPVSPVLVAEVDGNVRAALSLADGAMVTHPVAATTALVELLHVRAAQLHRPHARRPLRRLRLRLGLAVIGAPNRSA